MPMFSQKKILVLIWLMCIIALAYAFYAEKYQNTVPCPLCISERIIFIFIGILSLVFTIHYPKNFLLRIYGIIIALLATFGLKIAIHHIWLINLPQDQQPLSCGMPLAILYKKLPLTGFLQYILTGDAECGKITWTIAGISAPTWVAIWYGIILLLSCYIIFAKIKKNNFNGIYF